MYIFIILVHVIVCLVLILVVLLQAGRGGGMSDMMGGGQPQSLFGTQTNEFMTRATEVCAVLFVITSLSLGIISTQRGKSLVERQRFADKFKTAAKFPAMPVETKAPETPSAAPAVPAAASTAKPAETAAAAPSTSEANAK